MQLERPLLFSAVRIWVHVSRSESKKVQSQAVITGCIYGFTAGLILIFFGRPLSMIFLSKNATAVLDASAKYLRCLGFFFGILGILNVCQYGDTGAGIFRKSCFFRCYGDDWQGSGKYWFCRNLWLYSNLFC